MRLVGLMILGLFLTVAAPTWADEPEVPTADEPQVAPTDRGERTGPRGRMGRRERERESVDVMRVMSEFRKKVLELPDLDDYQREDISAILEEEMGRIRAEADEQAEARAERQERFRELANELREAREDNDPERIQDIRREMTELRRGDGEKEIDVSFFDAIRDLLTEEQVDLFDQLSERTKKELRGEAANVDALSLMRDALSAVQLSDEQKEDFRDLLTDAHRESMRLKDDAERRAELEAQVKNEVLDRLDDEQRETFNKRYEELLKRSERTRRGEGRDGREGRRGERRRGFGRDGAGRSEQGEPVDVEGDGEVPQDGPEVEGVVPAPEDNEGGEY